MAEMTRAPKGAVKKQKNKDPNRIRFFSVKGRVDMPMTVIILVLLVFGITMMFSAGHAQSYVDNDGDSFAYTVKQVTAAGIGLVGMIALCFFDYRLLRREFSLFKGKLKITLAHILLILTLLLNFMCIFGVGTKALAADSSFRNVPAVRLFKDKPYNLPCILYPQKLRQHQTLHRRYS